MKQDCNTSTRNSKSPSKDRKAAGWPRKIRLGRVSVSIYRRPVGSKTKTGESTPIGFMVANYSTGKRRFDSYSTEAEAVEAAQRLARQLSERQVLAASMTNQQAAEYSSAVQALSPFKLSLGAVAAVMAECLKLVGGDLPNLHAAAKFYANRQKRVVAKRVAEVVDEIIELKASRGAANRYVEDLRSRLSRFANDFAKDICHVTTAEVQDWLDRQKFSSQGYMDHRSRLHLLFNFAKARSYAFENPVEGVEKLKIKRGEIETYTAKEIRKLLAAAPEDFLPCLALQAFAGLRSAEVERLTWEDIHFSERSIVVGRHQAKTAARRVIPIQENLLEWLLPYASRSGRVWHGTHNAFYHRAQQGTADAAGVAWKSNALRHSFASYRFALTGDAGRVAGELGNSASVVHQHYKALVTASEAERWFDVRPEKPANVMPLSSSGPQPIAEANEA